MTKAAVKAFDTVEAFMKRRTIHKLIRTDIKKWVVAGASKRGWVSWLTAAAVPDRVGVCIPMIMDLLNMVPNMHHMYRAYGGWTLEFEDYYKLNFTRTLDEPETLELTKIIDAYYYRDRLTMPKLIVNAGNDEFFMPQDTHYWWSDMPEPKHWLFLPNKDHSTDGILEATPQMVAYIKTVQENEEAPIFSWAIDSDTGDITVNVGASSPKNVTMWYSQTCNDKRRDWRLLNLDYPCTCGEWQQDVCVNEQV